MANYMKPLYAAAIAGFLSLTPNYSVHANEKPDQRVFGICKEPSNLDKIMEEVKGINVKLPEKVLSAIQVCSPYQSDGNLNVDQQGRNFPLKITGRKDLPDLINICP